MNKSLSEKAGKARQKPTGKTIKTRPTGVEIMDKMQEPDKTSLDRFYDRNPWRGDVTTYIRNVVERNRRDRALFIGKGEKR